MLEYFSGMQRSDMDVAGADLTAHKGRRYSSTKDPRHASAPSFSFGRRFNHELNTMSSNNSFYCKSGTNRTPHGELLLDRLGRRDDKSIDNLKKLGQQWKVPPGPGAYRIPRSIGAVDEGQEVSQGSISLANRSPSWRIEKSLTPARPCIYHTLGGAGHTIDRAQSTPGRLRRFPTPRNLSPGPGRYFQDCDGGRSTFSDFTRPQNRQVV